MKDDNDTKEKELVALRLEHKRLTLQHTLLVSDHEMLKIKFSDTSGNAPNSYEQYQRQIDDWHGKFNARDTDVKLLTQQVENLKNVIVTQGLTMPPSEPVNAQAPASTRDPAPAPSIISSSLNGREEFPTPGPGWQFGGASRAANRPNWGIYHLQSPFTTMVGESHHLLLPNTALTTIRIRASNLNIELRASTLGEATTTSLREGGTQTITASPLAKEDVTLVMLTHALYDKNRGIKMVSPLLRPGLNHHMFVFMCALFRLELSSHYSYLCEAQTLIFNIVPKIYPLRNGMKTLTLPLPICIRLSACPLDSQCLHTFIIEPHNGRAKT
jgi:hypothetical protein